MSDTSEYAAINLAVSKLISAGSSNHVVRAYMIARAALLHVRHAKGPANATEMAYRLGDELAGEGGK